jgi:hypothetical protein
MYDAFYCGPDCPLLNNGQSKSSSNITIVKSNRKKIPNIIWCILAGIMILMIPNSIHYLFVTIVSVIAALFVLLHIAMFIDLAIRRVLW